MFGQNDVAAGSPAIDSSGVRVTVALDWDALEPGVQIDLETHADGAAATDSPEFRAWVAGVVHGVRYALGHAHSMPCVVRVVELAVGPEGATSMHVAAAASFAVWEALGVSPAPEALASIHARVAESRERELGWLPDLG